MKKVNWNEVQRDVNDLSSKEVSVQDKIFERDVKKAEAFKKAHYNPYAEEGNESNAEVMKQYKWLMDIAIRHADERAAKSNNELMKITNVILEKTKDGKGI
jgi:hypothetical protein